MGGKKHRHFINMNDGREKLPLLCLVILVSSPSLYPIHDVRIQQLSELRREVKHTRSSKFLSLCLICSFVLGQGLIKLLQGLSQNGGIDVVVLWHDEVVVSRSGTWRREGHVENGTTCRFPLCAFLPTHTCKLNVAVISEQFSRVWILTVAVVQFVWPVTGWECVTHELHFPYKVQLSKSDSSARKSTTLCHNTGTSVHRYCKCSVDRLWES